MNDENARGAGLVMERMEKVHLPLTGWERVRFLDPYHNTLGICTNASTSPSNEYQKWEIGHYELLDVKRIIITIK